MADSVDSSNPGSPGEAAFMGVVLVVMFICLFIGWKTPETVVRPARSFRALGAFCLSLIFTYILPREHFLDLKGSICSARDEMARSGGSCLNSRRSVVCTSSEFGPRPRTREATSTPRAQKAPFLLAIVLYIHTTFHARNLPLWYDYTHRVIRSYPKMQNDRHGH